MLYLVQCTFILITMYVRGRPELSSFSKEYTEYAMATVRFFKY